MTISDFLLTYQTSLIKMDPRGQMGAGDLYLQHDLPERGNFWPNDFSGEQLKWLSTTFLIQSDPKVKIWAIF